MIEIQSSRGVNSTRLAPGSNQLLDRSSLTVVVRWRQEIGALLSFCFGFDFFFQDRPFRMLNLIRSHSFSITLIGIKSVAHADRTSPFRKFEMKMHLETRKCSFRYSFIEMFCL